MTKVLSIAPFYDGTGYSHAAQAMTLALDAAGVDIYPVNVKLTGQSVKPHNRIVELLNKRVTSPDVIIQTVLPPLMVYHGGVKNIGYFFCETTDFKRSGWTPYLNNMDEVWVACSESILACKRSAVIKPTYAAPIGADMSIYQKVYPFENLKKGRYAFYSIGDWSARKNMAGVVEAYFRSFSKNDNVVLILKTYCEGMSFTDAEQYISKEIAKIKDSLRLWKTDFYPPVILITSYLSDEEIYGLHQRCDAYITMERAAGWGIPLFDAMAFGKPCISIKWGGTAEFFGSYTGDLIVGHHLTLVRDMQTCSYPGMYSGYEGWAEPDMLHAIRHMKDCYQNKITPVARLGFESKWSLKTVGNTLKELVCD